MKNEVLKTELHSGNVTQDSFSIRELRIGKDIPITEKYCHSVVYNDESFCFNVVLMNNVNHCCSKREILTEI